MVRNRVTRNLTILKIQKIAFCNGEKSGNPKSHHSKFNPTKASVLDQSNKFNPTNKVPGVGLIYQSNSITKTPNHTQSQ